MKSVSVIIPCYLNAATLARALDSVYAQTRKVKEVIVVNDDSPESAEIERVLLGYPHIVYVKNSSNVGLAASRNVGILTSTSDIISFLDADDEYDPQKIELQVKALEPGTAVTCGLMYIYPGGRKVDAGTVKEGGAIRVVQRASDLQYRNTLNGAGMLAPRELLLQHGLYDASLRSCEDYDLWLRLLSAGIMIRDVGRPLYLYHENPAGLSKNYRNISRWELEAVQRYAQRKGREWCCTREYVQVVTVWLLRHLMRSELAGDVELRKQTIANAAMLDAVPLWQGMLRMLARSRLMYIPAILLRLTGRFRSGY